MPLYYEAKLLFVVWLWHPRTKGAVYLYSHTLQVSASHLSCSANSMLQQIFHTSTTSNHASFCKQDAVIHLHVLLRSHSCSRMRRASTRR